MLVDKQRFKELKKVGGGISKLECALVVKVIDGFGLQNNKSFGFNIYPNGLYFDFVFGDKIYFSMDSIKEIKCINRIIEIDIEDEETIRLEIEKGTDIIKVYNTIVNYAGLMVEKLTDVEKSEKELNKIKKIEEREKRIKDSELTLELYRQSRLEERSKNVVDNIASCPKCGSTSITANKKGFSLAKGAAGVVAVGAIGVVAAGHGKNKVIVTCLNCGHQWKPGK